MSSTNLGIIIYFLLFLFGIVFAVHTPLIGGSGRTPVLSSKCFSLFGMKNAWVVYTQ